MDRVGRPGRRAERVLATLAGLRDLYDSTDVDELSHALQVATRAERAGADEEIVLAALCHDMGKLPAGAVDPRDEFAPAPWFDLAATFVDEWDMQSFDPGFEAEPLSHFDPLVRRLVIGP
jgi:hypothetical protein